MQLNSLSIQEWFESIKQDFILNFIDGDRYQFLLDGLKNTLEITVIAVLIGIFMGFLVAIVRSSYDKREKRKATTFSGKLGNALMWLANAVCKLYLTVIRGTPVVVQLMIIYYVIFSSVNVDKIFVAVIAFGLNSGAYVAEIVRSGIMSIEKGQFEAGRSLGFNYVQTMIHIVLPQAFKNVLPALGNELIVLLKETSVSGYIAMDDLTKGGDIIRSQTYSAFMPLIAVALIYLLVVIVLSALVNKLERRLRTSGH